LNAGVLGSIESEEVFLHRLIDVAMFRVQPEDGLLATAVVDFGIDPRISFLGGGKNASETGNLQTVLP
jgi:lipopolysaccharide transport system ATP-binding protein